MNNHSSSSSSGKANNNNNNNNKKRERERGERVLFLGSIYHYAGMDGVFTHTHTHKHTDRRGGETFEEEQTDEVVLIVGHNRGRKKR